MWLIAVIHIAMKQNKIVISIPNVLFKIIHNVAVCLKVIQSFGKY